MSIQTSHLLLSRLPLFVVVTNVSSHCVSSRRFVLESHQQTVMTDRQWLSVCMSHQCQCQTSKHLSKPINFNGNDVTFCVTTRTQNSSSSSAFPFMQTESPWTDADAGMRSRSASPSVLSDGILSFRAAQVVYAHISLCPPPTAHTAHTTHTTHTAHAHCVPTCPQVLSCFAKGRVPSDMAAAPQPCLKVNVDCAAMPSGHHMHGLSANPEMVTVLGGDDNEGEEEEYHQHEMGLQPKLAQNPPLPPAALKTSVPDACTKVPWSQHDDDLLLQVQPRPHHHNPHSPSPTSRPLSLTLFRARAPLSPQASRDTQLVAELGPRRWTEIAAQLPGARLGKQARDRWHNQLCPSVCKEGWTEEEETLIMQLVRPSRPQPAPALPTSRPCTSRRHPYTSYTHPDTPRTHRTQLSTHLSKPNYTEPTRFPCDPPCRSGAGGGYQVVEYRQDAARPHRQRHQEPLEQPHA